MSGRLAYLLKHATMRLHALTDAALAPLGLDGREMGVLLVLANGEPTSQQEAAQRLGIDRTTMVALLDALAHKGFISRRPSPEDRRRNVVALTEEGHTAVARAVKAADEAEHEFLGNLPPDAAHHLRAALRTVVLREP